MANTDLFLGMAESEWFAMSPNERGRRLGAAGPEVRWRHNQALARRRGQKRLDALRASESRLSSAEWKSIVLEFHSRCAYCGTVSNHLTKDHMIPLSRGGDDTRSNVVPACEDCNYRKNNKMPLEFFAGVSLRRS